MATERMYELAFRYKKTKLWQKILDDQVFAVKLSDGEIGYCSIMGALGELNAVAVFIGDKGFQSLRTLLSPQNIATFGPENVLLPLTQDCIMCSLVTKDELSPKELDGVRAYAKANGIRLAGPNAFPQFERYLPYRSPWMLTDEQDQRRICEVLEACIYLAEYLKAKGGADIGFERDTPEIKSLPLLEREGQTFAVKTTDAPPEIPPSYPSPRLSNDLAAARLRRLKKKGTLQCELTHLLEPVVEREDEAPYFPALLLAVDERTEMVMPLYPVTNFEDHPERVVDAFAESLLENGSCPGKIKVGDQQTFALLENLCKAAEIRLIRVSPDSLALLHTVKEDLLYSLNDDEDGDEEDWYGEDDDGVNAAFEMLMDLSDRDLRQIPKSMVRQLLGLSDVVDLPPELEARLRRIHRL